MTETLSPYAVNDVILTIRGHKVILDRELAMLYGVEVKRLNEQVKRNRNRFPEDFAFQLTLQEIENLKSQIATGSDQRSRSQFATLKRGHNIKYLPYAFTEHGVIMAATVLNSSKAVEMSVFVVRAFVKMREQLMATATLAKRLAEVEKLLLTHDSALRDLYHKIRPLLLPPPEPSKTKIGFGVGEARARYSLKSRSKKEP
ncbi:MAG: ORF6N domain-containing protein [Lentisphaerae bacterium]|nr:ORF6N domain-containing protein [Lentisphaerota bacterium]